MGASLINIHRSQTSFSEDAVLTTNYLDDNIVAGRIFGIGLAQSLTADTPIYFTSECLSDINALFLLPIQITPTEGFLILNIYEDTEYTGGTTITATNRNRTSDITSSVTIKLGAVGTEKGTLLGLTKIFGVAGTNQSSGGGESATSNSIVLDTSKRYLYELTNSETGTVGISAEFGEV